MEEFFGIYQPRIERDEDDVSTNSALPHYCLRKVQWDHREDALRYQRATNKKEYVKGKDQVDAISVFITSPMYPELLALIDELKRLAQQGIELAPVQRSTAVWDAVQVRLQAGTFDLHCSYSMRVYQNEALERWIMQWQKLFSQVDYAGGIFPTGNFFVTYKGSLEDELVLFPE